VKQGDLIRYRLDLWKAKAKCMVSKRIFIVRWVEEENDWVCVYGVEPPIQMRMMEIVSESRCLLNGETKGNHLESSGVSLSQDKKE